MRREDGSMGWADYELVTRTKPTFDSYLRSTVEDILAMMERKRADYTHIHPLSNFERASNFGVDPLLGLALRMSDKMGRLEAFCRKNTLSVQEEGVEDVFKDLIGYSLLALAMRNKDAWD